MATFCDGTASYGALMKLTSLVLLLLLIHMHPNADAQFRFRDTTGTSLELLDGDAPVFVYNYGVMLKEGVRADRARCCYLSPVYAPNGVVLTDDFPKEELHHRGLFWAWPVVRVGGRSYDLWRLTGIHARAGKVKERRVKKDRAILKFENRWFVGERPVVAERVEIVTHETRGPQRDLDFTLRLTALVDGVEIAGEPEQRKGYGGVGIRLARTGSRTLSTAEQEDAADGDSAHAPWAQFTGTFDGKKAGVRITSDSSNPGFPNAWCLRHYGFLGVNYPGLDSLALSRTKPLVLRLRITLAS
jgi:hypothetical protein